MPTRGVFATPSPRWAAKCLCAGQTQAAGIGGDGDATRRPLLYSRATFLRHSPRAACISIRRTRHYANFRKSREIFADSGGGGGDAVSGGYVPGV